MVGETPSSSPSNRFCEDGHEPPVEISSVFSGVAWKNWCAVEAGAVVLLDGRAREPTPLQELVDDVLILNTPTAAHTGTKQSNQGEEHVVEMRPIA